MVGVRMIRTIPTTYTSAEYPARGVWLPSHLSKKAKVSFRKTYAFTFEIRSLETRSSLEQGSQKTFSLSSLIFFRVLEAWPGPPDSNARGPVAACYSLTYLATRSLRPLPALKTG